MRFAQICFIVLFNYSYYRNLYNHCDQFLGEKIFCGRYLQRFIPNFLICPLKDLQYSVLKICNIEVCHFITLITLITLVAPTLIKAIVTYVTVKSVYFLHRSPCASLKPFNCQLCCHNSSTGLLSVIFVLLYNTLSSKCIATCLADQPVYFSSTSQCAPLEPLNYSRDCHNCSRHATI